MAPVTESTSPFVPISAMHFASYSVPRLTPASSWRRTTPTPWRWTPSSGTPSTRRSSSPAARTAPSKSGTTPSSKTADRDGAAVKKNLQLQSNEVTLVKCCPIFKIMYLSRTMQATWWQKNRWFLEHKIIMRKPEFHIFHPHTALAH